MKVYVKNKLVSLKGNSDVVNEKNEAYLRVQGKLISPTHKKFIKDLDDNLVYTVRNSWGNFFSHSGFIYNKDGEKIAKIKRPAFTFKPKFIVQGYKDEILIEGKIFTGSMTVTKNGEAIGTISRGNTFFTDSFCVDSNEEDLPFLVALTVAIDNIYDKMTNDRN